jgi:hypothetical protein
LKPRKRMLLADVFRRLNLGAHSTRLARVRPSRN